MFSGVDSSPFVLFLHLASKKSLSCSRSTIPFVLIYTILCAKSLQSCLTPCDPMGCSPPGCSVHGILSARILEWVAMPFSRGSSPPNYWTHVFHISYIDTGRFFTTSTTWEAIYILRLYYQVGWRKFLANPIYSNLSFEHFLRLSKSLTKA